MFIWNKVLHSGARSNITFAALVCCSYINSQFKSIITLQDHTVYTVQYHIFITVYLDTYEPYAHTVAHPCITCKLA